MDIKTCSELTRFEAAPYPHTGNNNLILSAIIINGNSHSININYLDASGEAIPSAEAAIESAITSALTTELGTGYTINTVDFTFNNPSYSISSVEIDINGPASVSLVIETFHPDTSSTGTSEIFPCSGCSVKFGVGSTPSSSPGVMFVVIDGVEYPTSGETCNNTASSAESYINTQISTVGGSATSINFGPGFPTDMNIEIINLSGVSVQAIKDCDGQEYTPIADSCSGGGASCGGPCLSNSECSSGCKCDLDSGSATNQTCIADTGVACANDPCTTDADCDYSETALTCQGGNCEIVSGCSTPTCDASSPTVGSACVAFCGNPADQAILTDTSRWQCNGVTCAQTPGVCESGSGGASTCGGPCSNESDCPLSCTCDNSNPSSATYRTCISDPSCGDPETSCSTGTDCCSGSCNEFNKCD